MVRDPLSYQHAGGTGAAVSMTQSDTGSATVKPSLAVGSRMA